MLCAEVFGGFFLEGAHQWAIGQATGFVRGPQPLRHAVERWHRDSDKRQAARECGGTAEHGRLPRHTVRPVVTTPTPRSGDG